MTSIAYSYLRFSKPSQATGDSRRRQLALAEKYAAEHKLTLDKQLSFRDLGVSAFRSQNAKEGALRVFLEAIEHGLVPRGSTLLVESLDRLSRDRIIAAQSLFLLIVQAGVTIVTLIDQRSYSIHSLNENPLDLIVSLVVLMRANEESQIKSERIRATFAEKRAMLSVRPWSARCPGWLRLDKEHRRFVIVEERANIVRRIFREALDGVGHQTIARQLNEEGVPLFGHGNQRGKLWHRSFVRHLLRYPAVIGNFTATVTEHVDGVRRIRPVKTVPGYFPPIIDERDWQRMQDRRKEWSDRHRSYVPKTGRANLLAGLAQCPYCAGRMVLIRGASATWRYFTCGKAYFGLGCSERWVRYPEIEQLFTADIDRLIKTCPKPVLDPDARSHRLQQIRVRLHTLRTRLASMEAERPLNWQINRPTRDALHQTRTEMEQLIDERKKLRIDRPRWLDVTLQPRLERLRDMAHADVLDRHAFNSALRAMFDKIVVDWPQDRFVLHWKHGGQSVVPASFAPLRIVSNPRRSDRPRLGPGREPPPLPDVAR
jgi:DNA invertase Pin-like site-specific DNA recombinase